MRTILLLILFYLTNNVCRSPPRFWATGWMDYVKVAVTCESKILANLSQILSRGAPSRVTAFDSRLWNVMATSRGVGFRAQWKATPHVLAAALSSRRGKPAQLRVACERVQKWRPGKCGQKKKPCI